MILCYFTEMFRKTIFYMCCCRFDCTLLKSPWKKIRLPPASRLLFLLSLTSDLPARKSMQKVKSFIDMFLSYVIQNWSHVGRYSSPSFSVVTRALNGLQLLQRHYKNQSSGSSSIQSSNVQPRNVTTVHHIMNSIEIQRLMPLSNFPLSH